MLREFPLKFKEQLPLEFYPSPVEQLDVDVVEIGPGRGDFLLQSAEANPNVRFAAVEIRTGRFRRLSKRIGTRGLTNVTLIFGDARVALPRFCRPNSLQQIYVLFPDPWPKNRHVQNRLLQENYLRILTGVLKPTGELFVATDVRAYIDWVCKTAAGIEALELTNAESPDICPISIYQPTYFEQKWRSLGREIHYAAFRRRA